MTLSARPLNSWDILKVIAILLMFVDHTGNWIYTDDSVQYWLRAIGRGAAPIFMFLAGYAASYRFSWELFILAVLLTVSDTLLLHHINTQNILVTIIVSRAIFRWLEKRGRIIKKPYEWYIGSVALFALSAVAQYGSLGFLFAICGYMQRHPQHYSKDQQRNFRILTFVTYAAFYAGFSIPHVNIPLLLVTLAGVYWLLAGMEIRDIQAPWCPAWLKKLAKLTSYYSAYIYVFHLIALEWSTGIGL